MGTRNLTAVKYEGDYRIAQYGQWDGYPGGQGSRILKFLRKEGNLEKLKKALSRVRFLDKEGEDKEFIEDYNERAPQWSSEPDNRTSEQKEWWGTYMNRDLGAQILKNVAESEDEEIILDNDIKFAEDSLFCEWAYVIDIDKGTLEVYTGFNETPLHPSDRFYREDFEPDDKYHPVVLLHLWSLDELPDQEEFIETLNKKSKEKEEAVDGQEN